MALGEVGGEGLLDGLDGQDGQAGEQGAQGDHVEQALVAEGFGDLLGGEEDGGDVVRAQGRG